jgi:hypothetical protein
LNSLNLTPYYIQTQVIQQKSPVADMMLELWSKMQALEDCIQGLREKELPI